MADLAIVARLTAQNQMSGPIDAASKALGALGSAAAAPIKAIGALTDTLGRIGLAAQGVQALASAASGLGQAMGVGLASEMEQVRAQLLAFVKDGAQVDAILAQIRAEADKTPFAFAEMAKATAMLQPAAQTSGESLMTLIQQAEILAALNPAEGLTGAAFSLREALSGDFVSVMERFNIPRTLINRLKEEGVPAAEIVSRALQAMGADMSLVSNLAQTTAGRFNTFQDAIDGIRVEAGRVILAQLGTSLDRLSAALDQNRPQLVEFARLAGDFLGRAVEVGTDALLGLVRAAHDLAPTIRLVGNTLTALVHGDFANFLAGARQLVEQGIGALSERFAAFAPTGERLGQLFGWVGERLEALAPLAQRLMGGLQDVTGASQGAEGVLTRLAQATNAVSGAVEGAIRFLQDQHQLLVDVGGVLLTVTAGVVGYRTAVLAQTAATAAWAAITQGIPALLGLARVAMLALNAAILANPIGLVVGALSALAAVLIYAYQTNEDFRNGVNAAWASIQGAVLSAVNAVQGAIAGLAAWFQQQGGTFEGAARAIGQAIVQGIGNGITAGIGWVREQAGRLAQSALSAAKEALGIASPSAEFEAIGADVVAGFVGGITGNLGDVAAAMNAILPVALDPIAKVQAEFNDRIERENVKHGRRMTDLERDLGQAKGKAREGVLERIRQAEIDHARRVEDLQTQHQDNLVDAEFDAARDRGRAIADFAREVQTLVRETAQRADEIGTRLGDALREAAADADRAIAETRERARQAILDAVGSLNASRWLRGVREQFGAGQDRETLERQRAQEEADFEADQAKDLAAFELKVQKDTLDLQRRRDRDDADARYEYERDLREAETGDERRQLEVRFNQRRQDTERRRRLDDAERARQLKEERQALDARQKAEREALAERRRREDAERAYRTRQEQDRQRFEDALEDDALRKTIRRIEDERDTRITEIGKALAVKQQQLRDDAAEELTALRKTAQARYDVLQEELTNKIGPLLKEEQDMLTNFLEDVTGRVTVLLARIEAAAAGLSALGSAARGLGAAGGIGRMLGGGNEASAWIEAAEAATESIPYREPQFYDYTDPYTSGPEPGGGAVYMAQGGLLREPIRGIGLRSGRRYVLAEAGPEYVVPANAGMGGAGGYDGLGAAGMGGGGSVAIDYDRLAACLARVHLQVDVAQIQQGLLTKARQSGGLGF